ncbi:MAG: bacteriohopanetetrol glucosamine biosynthesis glycosyltransferase HpnI [Stellaceae bacterium]
MVVTSLAWVLLAGGIAGSFYLVASAIAVRRFVRRAVPAAAGEPPVTILKPLCGIEPDLYENLRGYCLQRYPDWQVVFGVQNPRDPAIALVERLRAEFPDRDIALVVEKGAAGGNRKVANLASMLPAARHDILIMADADIRVDPDYLSVIAASLSRPGVGLVTCLYRGRGTRGFWSRLAALYVNHSFLPQGLLGEELGIGAGCFGATIALRRATLDAAGGFAVVADQLADDHALGEAVRRIGLRVMVASYLVDNMVTEPDLKALCRHELRWARTIRTVAPTGFIGLVFTHPLMLTACAAWLAGWSDGALAVLAWVALCRLVTVRAIDGALGLPPSAPWLLPVRDVLSLFVYITSYLTRTVAWRGQKLRVGRRGQLIEAGDNLL